MSAPLNLPKLRDSFRVIFVTGAPSAGKSWCRKLLATHLRVAGLSAPVRDWSLDDVALGADPVTPEVIRALKRPKTTVIDGAHAEAVKLLTFKPRLVHRTLIIVPTVKESMATWNARYKALTPEDHTWFTRMVAQWYHVHLPAYQAAAKAGGVQLLVVGRDFASHNVDKLLNEWSFYYDPQWTFDYNKFNQLRARSTGAGHG
jgi:hypothetical protein